ncbi:MAG: NAD-dependent epimerase/dehydratase family protein [Planctomycetes bacterium]|nr:NAD-dependent epimerase/dehydratase family protein [Planctomycetota bacterium]
MSGRVLVTGGAGFIGSHLCAALCAAGREVVVLDDLSTGTLDNLAGLPVHFRCGSVADPDAVAAAMQGVDRVVHLAALPSVARSVEDPLATHHACATGTVTLLAAVRRHGARVVYAGSSSAYGDQEAAAKHEGLRESPLSPYAAAKLAGELYCRAFARCYGLAVVVTRFFNVFGPRQPADSPYSGVVAAFCRALLAGTAPRIDGDGLQSRDFTYVEDVVDGLLRCLDAPTTGCEVVNLAYGQAITVRELYDRLRQLALAVPGLGRPLDPVLAPARAGDVRHSLAAVGRANALFGFAPRIGFAEGLRRTFDWYRSHCVRSSPA